MSNDNGESDVTLRSLRPHALLETFLAEAERPQRYPFHPWNRIGRKRREAITPICTSLAVFFEKGASKRTYIPKPDGKMRPLGIAALEDKIVQQATRTVLECICEEDFLRFSYGFRPQHVDLSGTCGWLLSVYRSWCQYYAVPSN